MIVVVGLSHRSAPVEVREKLAFGADILPEVLARLSARPELTESMFLSTCNRVEVFAAASTDEGVAAATQAVRDVLGHQGGATADDGIAAYLYEQTGQDAVRHIFRVAASLDSMVLGEPQILGQVKDACAKLSPDDQKRYAPAVGSLLQALADADISNSAALLKYPIVIKTLPDALKTVIPSIAADVVEEQTGVRPVLANTKVKIDISGSSVTIGIDGLGDVGNLSVADVITETTKRSVHWFTHTLTLLGTISNTKDTLTFEREVLNQMASAFAPAAPSIVVVKIPAFDSPEVTAAVAAPSISLAAGIHAKVAAKVAATAAANAKTAKADPPGKKGAAKAAPKKPAAPAKPAPAKKDDKK